MQDITNSIASTHLGQKSALIDKYDPSLLVAIPRIENRRQYNIKNENLPFLGFDVWHAYEFSVLLNNNLPITRVLKLKYSSDSEFLIESKSLKLYLNSFNMTNYG
ncbi:MAG: NADPH-dependent 7-cyano-7-deazaguanine reductase QueF, partial [Candidatus Gastranaerophilales bacterium]|nr:NADPH-dependent 7-cyano-7-deazaguanine reductase QueF [Candidatus Gastranaerophilales bacterium]